MPARTAGSGKTRCSINPRSCGGKPCSHVFRQGEQGAYRDERETTSLTAESFGWRDTMLASAALCWAVALMLQPLRGRLDTESSARHPIRLSDLRTTITAVLAVRELRSLSFACFAFNGTQAVFVAYFVTYMTSQGHPLVVA